METLTPEQKVGMSLDEIIKAERIRPAVSHNLLRTKRPFKSYRRPRTSQQWRLGRNGPCPPRWRNPAWGSAKMYQQKRNIAAFLARKQANAPSSSVFHRLGWNPVQYAGQRFLHRAKHFQKRAVFKGPFVPYRPFKFSYDPQRFQKIIAAQKFYQQQNGLAQVRPEFPIRSGSRVRTLNQVNLQELGAVLGGTITSVKESTSPEGSVVTTIKRSLAPDFEVAQGMDKHVQMAVAQIQGRPFSGIPGPIFVPKLLLPQCEGFDEKITPAVSSMPTCVRFGQLSKKEPSLFFNNNAQYNIGGASSNNFHPMDIN